MNGGSHISRTPAPGAPLRHTQAPNLLFDVRAILLASIAAAAIALVFAARATADSSLSQNWAGYAVHGATFQRVSGRWHQPRPSCVRGQVRYSAMWVGLGGYSYTSTALEQIGTELDCGVKGQPLSSAWYELVPGPSHTIGLRVRPGDLLAGSVTVVGQQVTLALDNLTTGHSFHKTVSDSLLDLTSAEWILEAPSACFQGTTSCRTLPLTNFKHASFTVARAQLQSGGVGTISNPAWSNTKITLGPGGLTFVTDHIGDVAVGTAQPSALINNGSSFKIAYYRRYVPAQYGTRLNTGRTYLRHAPGLFAFAVPSLL